VSKKINEFHQKSIEKPDEFWAEQAKLIHWESDFDQVLDYSRPPFAKWFRNGKTNLCFNAIDRHLDDRSRQNAIVYVSTETNKEQVISYQELYEEVNRFAALLKRKKVGKGDRVLIYMPMIPEAVYAMLACVRIGAIHSVVFGGFASASLAQRVDDCAPKVMVTADAGMRGGRIIPYKGLVDDALELAKTPPDHVILVKRGLVETLDWNEERDVDYHEAVKNRDDEEVSVEWLESNEPSYILYTSGTTGKPKGVQRDTGGHAVALAASMKHIYDARVGETIFTTSDIGWVVGHSYIVYAPLIMGMTTILYEGLPTTPDPGIWWSLVEKYNVNVMFSSPTAIRVLKKQDPQFIDNYNLESLKHLLLACEPLDESTHSWISNAIKKPVHDHFWQTETGWPVLTPLPGIEKTAVKYGSPSFPAYGYNLKVLRESDASEADANEKGLVSIVPPLPPGCMSTVWGDDERFVKTYFSTFDSKLVYSTFDWGIRDQDGYHFILGRTDDVINVAGHRIGTREIEEAIQNNENVSEVAVVGIEDALKGQMPIAFVVRKNSEDQSDSKIIERHKKEIMKQVDQSLGAIARPGTVYFVSMLPKTRSGKLLRRSIQAIAEGRDPGDLTTLEDLAAIEEITKVIKA
jgi:propionyl-CoA synthetase